ncbi:MAG: MarR family transcriptional regulator [Clostridia bacterium]|nr:MarR family transcriptional regulator [Clostridia bacterium]
MDSTKFDSLKLEHQLCFPLYAASREVIKQYKPFLDTVDLTYTQYIAMMLLWEKQAMTSKEMGERLYLDSGTLTPLLKKMEEKGLLTRRRLETDERNLLVTITEKGMELREKAASIPAEMSKCSKLEQEEAMELYRILYKMLERTEK